MENKARYIKFTALLSNNGVDIKKIDDDTITSIVDDICIDVQEEGEIVTNRIKDVVKDIIKDSTKSKKVMNKFTNWLNDNQDEMCESVDESMFMLDDKEEINERKARAPKLHGKAEKQRKNKASVMKLVNQDPAFNALARKAFALTNRLIKKYAKEQGISPEKVKISKITLRDNKKK